ncbi:hypothetical protein KKD37_01315 [Patescibacteria group bacterium]|nr:hypothetical protein [Patescibacteria group bacterium]
MIGKVSWFSPRKYSGWGLTPNCWQGWFYIVFISLPIIFIPKLPINSQVKLPLMYLWGLIFSFDFIHILLHLKKDEREILHEAIAERNAIWVMIAILSLGFAYQTSINQPDPIIPIAIIGSLIVKAITHFYLRHR